MLVPPVLLRTERLLLLPLAVPVIDARLRDAYADLPGRVDGRPALLRLRPSWPGDALAMFPALRGQAVEGGLVPGQYVVLLPAPGGPAPAPAAGSAAAADAVFDAVGMLGTIGALDAVRADGSVEIGYGMNAEVHGRGIATEAVGALVDHLLAQPGVRRVVASSAVGNTASRRVLEKNGFVRTGAGWNDEDGDLDSWELRPPS